IYTALTVGRRLIGARAALSGSVAELDSEAIAEAGDDLRAAAGSFDDLPVQVLRLLPVVGQNLDALSAVTTSSVGVVEQAGELRANLDAIEEEGVIQDGTIRFDLLQNLRDPLTYESANLAELTESVAAHQTGWLIPSLWSELDTLAERAETLNASAVHARQLLDRIGPLLGQSGPRTYLVMVVNNAELRGAGGIPSGLGTITIEDGKLELGRFHYYRDLSEKPYESVPSPPDYHRYRRYGADTTLWANTTMDPNVPDSALVASRLFRLNTGIATDGVLVADPRGIASLLEPDAPVSTSKDDSIPAGDIPQFAYSDAYADIGGESTARRNALVRVGRSAFETLINDEGSSSGLAGAGDAVSGGHLRFISFDEAEQIALQGVGVTGELATRTSDFALATVQNLGADKLDYHATRTVDHSCDITAKDSARCVTKMTIANDAPEGLPHYVAPNEPYGVMKSFAELYVPEDAEVTGVFVDDGPAEGHAEGRQDGLIAIGFELEILRDEEVSVSVAYDLPLAGTDYSLTVVPQPLTKDAEVTVGLKVGDEQEVRGPGSLEDGIWTYSGPLDGTLDYEIEPDALTGLSKLWEKVVRFWNGPAF
ncbi:MAG: hypothetical protein QOH26_664, partial [Actinomycetota bacterium]|nr:hypothetical protein [Actinomycetota bacterium]